MSETVELTAELIRCRSVTPQDGGCQPLIAEYLARIGFQIETLRYGEVDNLWARRNTVSPLLAFAGHTDVVPPGPAADWRSDPFTPEIRDGCLYGRGAADMKGGIAAMLTACRRFIARHPRHRGSIGFLLTSDEEGPATEGTVKVLEHLRRRNETIDWCVIGEPTSSERVGDVIKNGRRGSLNGRLRVRGHQGHVAYPALADNPVHRAAPMLAELVDLEWDRGNEFFGPTTFQISNINAGTGAENVIPGLLEVVFNLRFSTETSPAAIRERIESLLSRHALDVELDWKLSGQPFLTPAGELLDATRAAITELAGTPPALSTGGGTSDGRFIAPTGAQVIELGPVNATIHKANECASTDDLDRLSAFYERVLEKLLT
jgi:succinyl-diaminopimelate desuccinylase